MLKALIILLFIAMFISLMAGAGFLIKDDSSSRRLLTSLKVRVSLAAALLLTLFYGFFWAGLGQ
ncbi:DUF2909 family protein [Pistricoccus aurantiacus]|uniref:DUF2909 domain-containing protein n=1 Tax=Pistricoccus aurantiacus TaxID=1883414 RepID=A0A5B8SYH3_9GAMM|nr:DUF2909 family protein [Pistricoccus aurantiacus]QEA39888.1 DUF2909 domain-containing protein [Pistricoccus aurantiacus]